MYERLVKVVQEIEKKLEFLRHRRLGFLTFCSLYECWRSHPKLSARSPAKIERGLSRIRRGSAMHGLQLFDGYREAVARRLLRFINFNFKITSYFKYKYFSSDECL